ncbi:phosphorylase superfamily protein [Colletotrichum graminicola M1.001]|uniref:Phosphorylase superfamily protein n=1 Tax=Colletotrichum graminicola (strain M1.001 / M2 / FGSC 10212) TaxID=645133 RepID=E3Q3P5_COLGM|nr:phosphorylase superfamily protein [Colletotrichum graminicola M1.001]EFQ25647.1 phosphorylase superfamily protein [Colletotrichum graminicola M1.001]
MTSHTQPGGPGRLEDVRVAVICALPREYDAAILTLDEKWKAVENTGIFTRGSTQNHTIGRAGNHIVVVVLLLNMGKVGAATETARLKHIYPGLELAFLTGICGGVPSPGTANEMLLGDVVISKSIVQYDIGRQYPGQFDRKDTVEDNLGRPNKDIRTLLVVLETQSALNELQQRARQNLAHVQQEAVNAGYRTSYSRPSTAEDVLFEASYSHRHRTQSQCDCDDWVICDEPISTSCEELQSEAKPRVPGRHLATTGGSQAEDVLSEPTCSHRHLTQSQCGCNDWVICDQAISASCEELQCEAKHRVSRRRLATTSGSQAEDAETRIHIGRVGSGDTVMKSGEHRDNVAKAHGLIAFEMEGAGVWDEIPCIVVKGVCDYADSHKNKRWQDFAAAIAAATTRALLERYPTKENSQRDDANHLSHYVIPLAKNKRFVERTETSELKRMLFDESNPTVALVGLGGMGKTQIALDIAYWVKENKPEYSVFWVPAVTLASFEQAYADIAKELDNSLTEEDNDDMKLSVKQFLSSKRAGYWFLIVDNADDSEILHGSSDDDDGLNSYLPQSENGTTLFTTRLRDLAMSVADDAVVDLDAMNRDDAMKLLERSLHQQRQGLLQDSDSTLKLLDFLTHLPLAITQAAAYLNRNRHVSLARYLQLLQGTEQTRMSTLSREFDDRTRYPKSRNAIATTWLVSFDQIKQTDSYATELLFFISLIEPKSIPRSILYCSGSEDDMEYAIGTLCSYAFLVAQEDAETFDMHSLVHLAARFWAKQQSVEEQITRAAVKHLCEIFPPHHFSNRTVWRHYMPHALKLWRTTTQINESEAQAGLYLKVGQCLLRDARVNEAVKLLEHVVEIRATLDEWHPDRLEAQHHLAKAYRYDGQFNKAIKLLEHVVELRATLEEWDPDRLSSQHQLATAYHNDGKIKKAIKLLEHVMEIRSTLEEWDQDRLSSQHQLALIYRDDGQIKKAIKMLEHVTEVEATTLDEGHPDRLASQHELALTYHSVGRVQEAIKLLEHVVEVRETVLNKEHLNRLASQQVLAVAYRSDGCVQEAIKLLEHVVEVNATTLNEEHPRQLSAQYELALAYRSDGRVQEAIKLLEHVVEVKATTLNKELPSQLTVQYELALSYRLDGRAQEGIELLEHIVEVRIKTLEEVDQKRLTSQYNLALAYRSDGRIQEAIKLLEHIVVVEATTLNEEHQSRLASQYELAFAYHLDGRIQEAITLLEHVVEVQAATLDEGDPNRLVSQQTLATCLAELPPGAT